MSQIRLSKLPDRTPVRITVSLSPELGSALNLYATFYRTTYDKEEAVTDLVPAIVAAFLDGDRAFARWCRDATGQPN